MSRVVHLIGVCGTAMATLAALLKRRGHTVRGSDEAVYPPMSDFLAEEGIVILDGYRADHIADDIDLVVIGNAVSRGNPEVEEVLQRKLRYCSAPEAIRDHFLWGARSIVVTGTHGKTTTTALTSWLLTFGGLDPSMLVGGVALNFGAGGASYRLGGGRDFVIEGDEYDSAFFDKTAKFLKYVPDLAIVNNIEFDHADIYADLAAIRTAFQRFVRLLPRRGLLLLGADNEESAALGAGAPCRVETFGVRDGADWQAHDITPAPGGSTFQVSRKGAFFGRFDAPLMGAHNVCNALAAIATATDLGLDAPTIAAGLRAFRGVKRRLELRGDVRGVTVYDDFAHHPTAVAETLAAVRASHPRQRVWAVFEPRSATSCRRVFQKDFARAFARADEVVLAPVYRSTAPEAERLSIAELVDDLECAHVHARAVGSIDDIPELIAREAGRGDLVIVMSNGGFGGVHDRILAALRGDAA